MTIHCYRWSSTGHALRKAKLRLVHEDSMDLTFLGMRIAAEDELSIVLYDGVDLSENIVPSLPFNAGKVVIIRSDSLPQLLSQPR